MPTFSGDISGTQSLHLCNERTARILCGLSLLRCSITLLQESIAVIVKPPEGALIARIEIDAVNLVNVSWHRLIANIQLNSSRLPIAPNPPLYRDPAAIKIIPAPTRMSSHFETNQRSQRPRGDRFYMPLDFSTERIYVLSSLNTPRNVDGRNKASVYRNSCASDCDRCRCWLRWRRLRNSSRRKNRNSSWRFSAVR